MEYEFADCSTDPLVILMMREGDEDTGEMESCYTAGMHRAKRYEGDRYEGDRYVANDVLGASPYEIEAMTSRYDVVA